MRLKREIDRKSGISIRHCHGYSGRAFHASCRSEWDDTNGALNGGIMYMFHPLQPSKVTQVILSESMPCFQIIMNIRQLVELRPLMFAQTKRLLAR